VIASRGETLTASAPDAESAASGGHQQPEAAMSDMRRIVLDTLGKLHTNGHGLFGYCRSCRRHFEVPLPAPSRRAALTVPWSG